MEERQIYPGKVVGGSRYVHKDALKLLDSASLIRVKEAIGIVPDEIQWNVVKLDLKDAHNHISYLERRKNKIDVITLILRSRSIRL